MAGILGRIEQGARGVLGDIGNAVQKFGTPNAQGVSNADRLGILAAGLRDISNAGQTDVLGAQSDRLNTKRRRAVVENRLGQQARADFASGDPARVQRAKRIAAAFNIGGLESAIQAGLSNLGTLDSDLRKAQSERNAAIAERNATLADREQTFLENTRMQNASFQQAEAERQADQAQADLPGVFAQTNNTLGLIGRLSEGGDLRKGFQDAFGFRRPGFTVVAGSERATAQQALNQLLETQTSEALQSFQGIIPDGDIVIARNAATRLGNANISDVEADLALSELGGVFLRAQEETARLAGVELPHTQSAPGPAIPEGLEQFMTPEERALFPGQGANQ